MQRTLAVLGGLVLLADAGPARGQVVYGPVGWGHGGGVGFAFGGKRFAVTGFVGGGFGVAGPVWGPPVYGPWCYHGGPWSVVAPASYWVAPPVVFAPPPVVLVGYAAGPRFNGGFGGFGPDDRPRPDFDLPPARDPFAAERVNAAVNRGDLLVFRPNGGGVQAAGGAPRPPDPPRVKPEPVAVAKDPKDLAKEAFVAGQYGRAAERLAAAVATRPDDAATYFLLAQARVALGEYAGAVEAIRDGMRRAANWPAAKVHLREVYGPNAAAFDEHLAELKKAAAADPADPTLGFLLGYHLWFLGEKAEAVKLFERAGKRVRDGGVIERFLREAGGKKG